MQNNKTIIWTYGIVASTYLERSKENSIYLKHAQPVGERAQSLSELLNALVQIILILTLSPPQYKRSRTQVSLEWK